MNSDDNDDLPHQDTSAAFDNRAQIGSSSSKESTKETIVEAQDAAKPLMYAHESGFSSNESASVTAAIDKVSEQPLSVNRVDVESENDDSVKSKINEGNTLTHPLNQNDVDEEIIDENKRAMDKEKELGKYLDEALDALHETISESISTLRHDENKAAQRKLTDLERKNSNSIFVKLRDSSRQAYQALAQYVSLFESRPNESLERCNEIHCGLVNTQALICLGEINRSRLISIGRNLWMTITSNPDLFNDLLSDHGICDVEKEGNYVTFEGKKCQAIAGGYARAVAARLVLLNYIDSRSSFEYPANLHVVSNSEDGPIPSVEELVFGLKVFSKAGKAILKHSQVDAQASHVILSLAVSCFNAIKYRAKTDGQAANEIRELFDDAFETLCMLPHATSIFGLDVPSCGKPQQSNTASSSETLANWPNLILVHLKQIEMFLCEHCNLSDGGDQDQMSATKVMTLQTYLPSFARMCFKHGSHFAKIEEFAYADEALQLAIKNTEYCLQEIRVHLERENYHTDKIRNKKRSDLQIQVFHNLEAELVLLSIEAFYVLSHVSLSTGKKNEAIEYLDMIEKYMKDEEKREDTLFSAIMSKIGENQEFVFSEGDVTTAVIEGPKQQDKNDLKSRAIAASATSKKSQAQGKATLLFNRIMIYHKTLPHPSIEEEILINHKIQELADLTWKSKKGLRSDGSSSCHALNNVTNGDNKVDDDSIFTLTLSAIRIVHIRRIITKVSEKHHKITCSVAVDPYKTILEKVPLNHGWYPSILLDKLNAMLTARHQIQVEKVEDARSLDDEILCFAHEFVISAKSFFAQSAMTPRKSHDVYDTTLFVAPSQSFYERLFRETKIHFARAVSLYYSLNAYEPCSKWSDMLEGILYLGNQKNLGNSGDINALIGETMSVKAYSLSMSGNYADGFQIAYKAWDKIKTAETMVTLIHCSLRHELRNSSCDTLLELDNALNELSSSETELDQILYSFPRMSNSCIDNDLKGGEIILLGIQERWLKFLLNSKSLHQLLQSDEEFENYTHFEQHRVFEVLRAYLLNFEHIIQRKVEHLKVVHKCVTFLQIIDEALKLLMTLRDKKSRKSTKGGREGEKEEGRNTLIWDDTLIKKIIGERNDCIWIAEQLWNIGNRLMSIGLGSVGDDSRRFCPDVFAGAHDFCLMSEEVEEKALSKEYLDIDTKYYLEKSLIPKFNSCPDRPPCEISSEFSGQCLLLSAATAVDWSTSIMHSAKKEKDSNINAVIESLLRQSLHRLTQAKEEFQLNCEDALQKNAVNKIIALLTLRCLIGVGDDTFSYDCLTTYGLKKTLYQSHQEELLPDIPCCEDKRYIVLHNVFLMAAFAESKKMNSTSRLLLHLCAQQIVLTGKFTIHLDQYVSVSLGATHRKIIQYATTTKEIIKSFDEVDQIVKKHRSQMSHSQDISKITGDSFFSEEELGWFTIEAYNRGVNLSLLADFYNAEILFAISLNIIPICCEEVRSYAKDIQAAYQHALSKKSSMGESLGAILSLVSS